MSTNTIPIHLNLAAAFIDSIDELKVLTYFGRRGGDDFDGYIERSLTRARAQGIDWISDENLRDLAKHLVARQQNEPEDLGAERVACAELPRWSDALRCIASDSVLKDGRFLTSVGETEVKRLPNMLAEFFADLDATEEISELPMTDRNGGPKLLWCFHASEDQIRAQGTQLLAQLKSWGARAHFVVDVHQLFEDLTFEPSSDRTSSPPETGTLTRQSRAPS